MEQSEWLDELDALLDSSSTENLRFFTSDDKEMVIVDCRFDGTFIVVKLEIV